MAELLDLQEHEFRSIRKWLNQSFPGRDIHIQRPTVEFSRPAMVLTTAGPRQNWERGKALGVEAEVTWQIEVLGTDFFATMRDVAQIKERLLTSRVIPLYLWSWRYPSPIVEVDPAGGALSAGNVSVIVSAVNSEGEESLGSDPVVTAVSAGDAIEVLIPSWPRGSTVAEVFRVYAGAPGSELLEAEITDIPYGVSTVVPLTTLAGTGAVPPSDSVSFFYRFMRLLEPQIESEILEHPETDGVFNGFVRARLSTLSQRVFDPVYPVGEITITQEVG